MKKIRISAIIISLLMLMQLFGCAVSIPVKDKISSEDEAVALGLYAENEEEEMRVGEHKWLGVKIKIDYNYALQWSSDNTDVATVDSSGRVDALSVGEVFITAKAETASVKVKVVVKEAKAKDESTDSTTALRGNETTEKNNKNDNSGRNMYSLLINTSTGCITAYTYNSSSGSYVVPVRSMSGSVAKNPADTYAYEDDGANEYYYVGKKTDDADGWSENGKNKYYRYTTEFFSENGEGFKITSCEYSKKASDALVTEEYNKLGTAFTDGDIRLSAYDAKWIYDNCKEGTAIRFIENFKDPFGVPGVMRIGEDSPYKNWDPTDPHKKNPYKDMVPTFKGMDDITIQSGSVCDLRMGVEVYDSCMNLVTDKYDVSEKVMRDKIGRYVVTYTYKDLLGNIGTADRIVYVE